MTPARRAKPAPIDREPRPQLVIKPSLRETAPLPFVQRIELMLGDRAIGTLTWHCLDTAEGAIQLLDWHVAEDDRRRGHAVTLFNAAIDQADRLHRQRDLRLRRVWIAARQKSQIVGRSLLTRMGFHHVGVAPNVSPDQDLMMYVKTYD